VLAELGLAVNNPISRMNMNLHSGHLPGKNAHVTPFFRKIGSLSPQRIRNFSRSGLRPPLSGG
jgi:hypothetical protein